MSDKSAIEWTEARLGPMPALIEFLRGADGRPIPTWNPGAKEWLQPPVGNRLIVAFLEAAMRDCDEQIGTARAELRQWRRLRLDLLKAKVRVEALGPEPHR